MIDMELIIKIPEEEYINIKNAINSLIENGVERDSMSKVCLAILDGVPLPKEATNGDMIKALFPSDANELNMSKLHLMYDGLDYIKEFRKDWWNTPYKRESEE